LPPLSTGRIGRATSRNGLSWRRDDEGSADSERLGTVLGLNAESWYGFDTSHVGLGQVMIPMTTPTIRSEGGVYVMYYMGGNFERSNVVSYLPPKSGSSDDNGVVGGPMIPEEDASELRGVKMRIGAAISQDGITWGRVEGDDPSGACMVPYDRGDINNVDVSVAKDEKTGRPYHVDEELYCVSFFSFVFFFVFFRRRPPPPRVCLFVLGVSAAFSGCRVFAHGRPSENDLTRLRDIYRDGFFSTLSLSHPPPPLLSRDGRR
jgi:hypothetical protein